MKRDDKYAQELFEIGKIGVEAETFLKSNVGMYLMGRAQIEIDEGVTALKTIEPTNMVAIMALQNQIYRAESIKAWITEMIMIGEHAHFELDSNGL